MVISDNGGFRWMAKFRLITEQKHHDPEGAVRRHRGWMLYATSGFLVTSALLVPFLDGNPLNKYWRSGGRFLLVVDMVFFVAAVFEAGFTWVLWSTLRDMSNRAAPREEGPKAL